VTCGNGEDDVSLVSDPTNGHRILDNVDTTILSVIKVFNNIWQLVVQCTKRMMMVNKQHIRLSRTRRGVQLCSRCGANRRRLKLTMQSALEHNSIH
jgi:hypothetical protein